MKKFGFVIALLAFFFTVNTVSAQSFLPETGKIILVKLDPSTKHEARAKLLGVLSEGQLSGYIVAEESYIVTIPDNATKIQTAKTEILTVYPAAQFSVITPAQANVMLTNQRNNASAPAGGSHN